MSVHTNSVMKNLALFLCALIWGVSFVVLSEGMKYIGPFTFTFARFLLITLLMLPFYLYKLRKTKKETGTYVNSNGKSVLPLKAGLLNGVLSFLGIAFQQMALTTVSPGKAAFISASYIIWVPLIGIFVGKQISKTVWLAVLSAVSGMYFLTLHGEVAFARNDLILVVSAIFFALQILVIDKYTAVSDTVSLLTITFAVCTLLAAVIMLFTEEFEFNALLPVMGNLLYAGILSSALAQFLQVFGQEGTRPAVASLLLSLESALSVLAAHILVGEVMNTAQAVGCALMFVAIVLAQIPTRRITEEEEVAKMQASNGVDK